jgi:hypothetical protein
MNKKLSLLKNTLFVSTGLALSLLIQPAKAQNGDIGQLFKGGQEDANKLFEAYAGPYFKGFGSSLNAGWANTAKTHNFLNKVGFPVGFNLTIFTNASIVPTSDRTYDVNKLGLINVEAKDPNNSIAPTIAGSSSPGPDFKTKTGGFSFASPQGSGYPYIGAPGLQLGLGFFKNTDLIVRYIPQINTNDYSIEMLGFGIKHDIKQWIPKVNLLPFDLSVLFGYSDLKAKYYIDKPNGQYMDMNVKAYTYGLIISKKIALLTLYGGLGYDMSKTDFKLIGTYATIDGTQYKDPINAKFDGSNGIKGNVGFRLKFAVITLHADYTLAKYQTVSAGLGFSIGE